MARKYSPGISCVVRRHVMGSESRQSAKVTQSYRLNAQLANHLNNDRIKPRPSRPTTRSQQFQSSGSVLNHSEVLRYLAEAKENQL